MDVLRPLSTGVSLSKAYGPVPISISIHGILGLRHPATRHASTPKIHPIIPHRNNKHAFHRINQRSFVPIESQDPSESRRAARASLAAYMRVFGSIGGPLAGSSPLENPRNEIRTALFDPSLLTFPRAPRFVLVSLFSFEKKYLLSPIHPLCFRDTFLDGTTVLESSTESIFAYYSRLDSVTDGKTLVASRTNERSNNFFRIRRKKGEKSKELRSLTSKFSRP